MITKYHSIFMYCMVAFKDTYGSSYNTEGGKHGVFVLLSGCLVKAGLHMCEWAHRGARTSSGGLAKTDTKKPGVK